MTHEAQMAERLRNKELAERNAEHETEYYLLVNEAQVVDIAAGLVPLVVKAMARTLLDWEDQGRRLTTTPGPKRKASAPRRRRSKL